ncbi:MAG: TetR/AcrR family transcriptional regulator [Bacillaceae bacterium]|nr:TetR/AcrR family transcriptional regulator [Bacillaceae bacterium]
MARKTGDKYQAIIDAAVKVIARHGYHHAQVSKIAREANVADGTIYLYFKNKDDILISLFKEKMGSFFETTHHHLNELDRAEDKLRELIHLHFSLLSENRDLAIVTQIELRQSDPDIRYQIGVTMKRYFQIIDDIVSQGIEEGVFRDDLDVRIIRRMIFGTIDEAITAWVMKDQKYDIVSLTDSFHSLFVNGLRAR